MLTSCCCSSRRCDGKPANPVELFGDMLEAAGYAKYGQETLISGVTGEEMTCDIYMGLVYYQRLRHMVSDKFQVSAGTGASRSVPVAELSGVSCFCVL